VINTPWFSVRIQNITHIHIRPFDSTHRRLKQLRWS
jgi:hypothetical protein